MRKQKASHGLSEHHVRLSSLMALELRSCLVVTGCLFVNIWASWTQNIFQWRFAAEIPGTVQKDYSSSMLCLYMKILSEDAARLRLYNSFDVFHTFLQRSNRTLANRASALPPLSSSNIKVGGPASSVAQCLWLTHPYIQKASSSSPSSVSANALYLAIACNVIPCRPVHNFVVTWAVNLQVRSDAAVESQVPPAKRSNIPKTEQNPFYINNHWVSSQRGNQL
jgi:hypothetical protein